MTRALATIGVMSNRYAVTQLPNQTKWVILDRELYAYCTLDDGHGNLLPLEWNGKPAAEAWLYECQRLWTIGAVPAPEGWRPRLDPSPFDRGWRFYN